MKPRQLYRAELLSGDRKPRIALVSAWGDWIQVCTTAENPSSSAFDQTDQVMQQIRDHLIEYGSGLDLILSARIWIKREADLPDVVAAWNGWIPKERAPVMACRRADMAVDTLLVEIRVDAVRAKNREGVSP